MSTAALSGGPWARHVRLLAIPLVVALVGTAALGRTRSIQVHSGDTLSGLAVAHQTTVDVLRALNHLGPHDDVLQIGQRLLIPAAAPYVAPQQHPVAAAPTTKVVTYTVQGGDTLTAVARHYAVSVEAIATRNRLGHGDLIVVGEHLQVLVPVPVTAPTSFAGRTYPPATLRAAAGHRAALAALQQPTQAQARLMIVATAQKLGLDPALALAIGWQESGFDQHVVSPADAIGIMQVVPSTGDYISTYLVGHKLDLLAPADNITAGVALLRELTKAAAIDQAVAGYYQGIESVRSKGMYADTKAYVANVLALRRHFAG